MALKQLPEIDFIDIDPEKCRDKIISGYENYVKKTLYPGNPERLFLEALAYLISVLAYEVDYAAKQGLVGYAEKAHLDHLGAINATPRLGLLPANTILRFSLAKALPFDVQILKGTRVSTADRKVLFLTDIDAKIDTGEIYIDVPATASKAGAEANKLVPGQINTLVDVPAYIVSVQNIKASQAGADQEQDEDYRQRIALAREAYTCAGPHGMYEYFVKKVHKDIVHAGIYTPVPGTVGICPVLRGGKLPREDILKNIEELLNADHVRPLTDKLKVHAPTYVGYSIELDWYLYKEDASLAGSIGAAVSQAKNEYIEWQHAKAGRDINPDELITRIKKAGAKRVVIKEPKFQALSPYELAKLESQAFIFAGVEDE